MRLFAIDETRGDLGTPGYSEPLTVEFLSKNNKLIIDTRFFEESFKARLVATIDDLDEKLDGLMVNSENLQATLFLRARYGGVLDGVYLDPPYNTDASEIIYKNGYKNSSWACLMFDRLRIIRELQNERSAICVTIDDFEKHIVRNQLDSLYGTYNDLSTVAIRSNPQGRSTVQGFSINHEYGLFYRMSEKYRSVGRLSRSQDQIERYNETDEEGKPFLWENFRKTGTDSHRKDRVKQYYPIVVKGNNHRIPKMSWNEVEKEWAIEEEIDLGVEKIVYPIDEDQNERVWKWGHDRVKLFPNHIKVVHDNNGGTQIYRRNYLTTEGALPGTWWDKGKYGAGSHGTNLLTAMFGKGHVFSFPKSVYAVEDCIRVITNSHHAAVVGDFFGGSGTTAHAIINLNRGDKGIRKYLLVEIGAYFDEIMIPRIKKTVLSPLWDAGKPKDRDSYLSLLKQRIKEKQKELYGLTGFTDKTAYEFERQFLLSEIKRLKTEIESFDKVSPQSDSGFVGWSHAFKYLRLESYEDTLNNLRFDDNPTRHKAMASTPSLKEDFMLHYLLDVETKGSQSLLNIDAFSDPTAYTLKVKKPGSDEYVNRNVDLLETFNYLIGLRVVHIAEPQVFNAIFARITDPELPEDQHTKLVIDGKMRKVNDQLLMTSEQIQPEEDPDHCSLSIDHCSWWFRKVEGWVPKNRENSNNGQKEKVLIVWRKLTGDPEKDNLMLDEWFEKNRISTRDFEFDTIYVNGSNNLPNLQKEGDTWKVRLIEEEFMKRMWDIEEV